MADGVEVVVRGVKGLLAGKAKVVGVAVVVGGGMEAIVVRSRALSEWVCCRLPSCQVAGWSEAVFLPGARLKGVWIGKRETARARESERERERERSIDINKDNNNDNK